MSRALFTCPDCLHATVGELPIRFCAQCRTPVKRESDTSMHLKISGQSVEVGSKLAAGDVCNLYHGRLDSGRAAVVKIARKPDGSGCVAREADVLDELAPQRHGVSLPRVPAEHRRQVPLCLEE